MAQADERKIIHVDMDAFFASVEQRDDPELRVIGGPWQAARVATVVSRDGSPAFGQSFDEFAEFVVDMPF